ncbi:hypothetical protein RRSWK_06394 [Rhodopirellula sp. SWK7]|nr:hypothetical protein RRSWK_06394 [Rhodopirellula sp. SWK7]
MWLRAFAMVVFVSAFRLGGGIIDSSYLSTVENLRHLLKRVS